MPHAFITRAAAKSLVAVALLTCVVGCTTTIPDTDTTPPHVELRISGPGVGNQLMSNPPLDLWVGSGGSQYLELIAGADYRFTLLVTDDGGVSRAYLSLPENLELSDIEPAGVVTLTDALLNRLTIAGNRADPRTALTITGRMGTMTPTELVVPSTFLDNVHRVCTPGRHEHPESVQAPPPPQRRRVPSPGQGRHPAGVHQVQGQVLA